MLIFEQSIAITFNIHVFRTAECGAKYIAVDVRSLLGNLVINVERLGLI